MMKLEDIFVVFDKGGPLERTALREINLSINNGDKISIIGNNGSGKSTLLKLLAGHISTSFGKIYFSKENITDQTMNERALNFSTIFSDYNVNCFDDLTVIENLILANFSADDKMSIIEPAVTNERVAVVREYLDKYDFLDLANVLFTSIKNISYEERQALCLMMVLMRPAKVLLIDDFVYGLKTDIAQRLWNTAKKIIENNNMTVLAVLEEPRYDSDFFNRTIVLNSGKIVLDVTGEAKSKMDFTDIFTNLNITPHVKDIKTKSVTICNPK